MGKNPKSEKLPFFEKFTVMVELEKLIQLSAFLKMEAK
jgi:hypothetical protein